MNDTMRLTVLGARGSSPVSGRDKAEFGHASSCYLLEAGGQAIFLDAGTGLLNADAEALRGGETVLLLSHCHADHLLGLPLFPLISQADAAITIYGRSRDGLDIRQQLTRFLSPPLWPCGLEDFPARLRFRELEGPVRLGPVTVEHMEIPHPGGCTAFRLSCGGKRLVYASDFEHTGDAAERLAAFAAGADLLLFDAQYSEEEYARFRGYGHSTARIGLEIHEKSGAKALLLIHHAPTADDRTLRARESALPAANARYAREGDVILL